MESQELIAAFKEQLKQVEAQGGTQVQVSALRAYLAALEKDAEASQEYRKREHEGMLAQYEAKSQQSIEMLKAVLETGKSALHSLLIINGGAVIALLGVLSNLAGKSNGALLAKYLALPLIQFGIGVLCGALGFAFRYFSQACYAASMGEKDKPEILGDGFRYTAIFSAIVGFVLFGFAITNAYFAVVRSFSP
jgi:archaellum biogenesis protein FlaJ (TadC family)